MNICRNCGAQVPPEKAWCPQCNEPVEAEARRTVEREIDSFAGTLLKKPKARPSDLAPSPPAAAARRAPEAIPPRGPETAANPAITTGTMPTIVAPPVVPVVPPVPPAPTPAAAPPLAAPTSAPKSANSRLVIYVAVGLVLGLALLGVMITVAIILWNSSR